jgi:hypothetical protein
LENKIKQRKRCTVKRGKYCEVYKILPPRWHGRVERMRNSKLFKQIATVTVEGTIKRGRPRKRWRDKVEEDLIYDIYLLTAVGLTPGGSSTVHIYTQTMN